jgi:hypothetical protein
MKINIICLLSYIIGRIYYSNKSETVYFISNLVKILKDKS